ncbi:ABC transporter permease [Cellulomonas uda]|uniref:ABC transporter permease n=1 Tax=Cellulomonas uda TaxID=1714 RepID=A0A4Y3K5V8_CELUD|nr:ABC transporter permease [Cellulomonas uda]NII67401.1 peptide/nickel transport system permease protein [Cellulomonas uda]GEA79879.1 ABC transporter permease [Cellulomonas uda]
MTEQTTERMTDSLDSGEVAADLKGKSQGALVRKRFFGHTGAIVSLVVLALVVILALTSVGIGGWHGWWKFRWTDTPPLQNGGRPTLSLFPFSLGEHPFGQDSVGRDYFAMTMRGTQISLLVTFVVGVIAAFVGVVFGALSGYFRGWVEAVLMRLTDMVIIIPVLLIGAVIGYNTKSGVVVLGLLLGLTYWTGMARLVRGDFLSLREREFVDAARLAGASDKRIIFKHILPNAVGVITVNTTLLMSSAILLETSLSYLNMGVKAPDTSLGLLISQNQAAFATRPWLFWWPGLFIVLICLCINFIGDGLRDAFDPRQRKISLRRMKETPREEIDNRLEGSLLAANVATLDGARSGWEDGAPGVGHDPDPRDETK